MLGSQLLHRTIEEAIFQRPAFPPDELVLREKVALHRGQVLYELLRAQLLRPVRLKHQINVDCDVLDVSLGVLKNAISVPEIIDAAAIFLYRACPGVRIALRLDKACICHQKPGVVTAVAVEEFEHIESRATALNITESKRCEVVTTGHEEKLDMAAHIDDHIKRGADDLTVVLVASDELCQRGDYHLSLLLARVGREAVTAESADRFDNRLQLMAGGAYKTRQVFEALSCEFEANLWRSERLQCLRNRALKA